MKSVILNCTLKPSPDASNTEALARVVIEALEAEDVTTETVRVVDNDVRPGVENDMGDGDEWPDLRRRILNAGILIVGTPIWLGQPSSVCKRVLERMDAFLGETDDDGRMVSYDRVAILATVGNTSTSDASASVWAGVGNRTGLETTRGTLIVSS